MTLPGDDDGGIDHLLAALLAGPDPGLASEGSTTLPNLPAAFLARLEADRAVADLLGHLWPRPTPRPPDDTPIDTPFPFRFGRFVVRRRLGAGGCGVVFLADDPDLGREVALKVPRAEALARPDLRRRFLREARAAAVLSHPNLVPVYEAAGADAAACFIAAEYCPGPTLAEWVRGGAPAPPRDAAELVAALAAGVGYAHRRGVIHRDLKPSNVLLAPHPGSPCPSPDAPLPAWVPKVADFGFAKLGERADGDTQSGAVIGTPRYMAPEQADGRSARVGPAADVYALGTVLYELLTGRPAVAGGTNAETLRAVVADDPVRPRSVNPAVPRDLEAVCLKCLAKAAARRYPDGDALAADLQRFLDGKPTEARPAGPAERTVLWCRRNPVPAVALAVIGTAVAALGGLGWVYERDLAAQDGELVAALGREKDAVAEADRRGREASESARAARFQTYVSEIRYAAGLAAQGRLTSRDIGPWQPVGGDDLRGFEWHHLTRVAGNSQVWEGHDGTAEVGPVTPDGKWVASSGGRDVFLRDARTGRVVERWPGAVDRRDASTPVVSPDGRFVVVGNNAPNQQTKGVAVLGIGGSAPKYFLPLPPTWEGNFGCALLPPDRIAVVYGTSVRVYRYGESAPDLVIDRPERGPSGLTLRPDGRVLAVSYPGPATQPCEIVEYDAVTGRRLRSWAVPPVIATPHMTYSSDNRHLLVSHSLMGLVSVWDTAAAGEPKRLDPFETSRKHIYQLTPLVDGRVGVMDKLLEAAWHMTIGFWNPRDGRWTSDRVDPGCRIASVAIRPDGSGVIVGSENGTVRTVELKGLRSEGGWPAHSPAEAWAVAVSPDGGRVATGGDDHAVRLWDARNGEELAARTDHASLVTSAAFAPGGDWFVTGSFDGRAIVRDGWTARPRRTLAHGAKVRTVAVSPDGRTVAAAGDHPTVTLWDADAGRLRHRLTTGEIGEGHVKAVAFTADGRHLIAPKGTGELGWWEVATGRPVRVVPAARITAIGRSPDGRRVVTGTEAGIVTARDAETGAELWQAHGPPRHVTAVAVAPDGKTVASSDSDGAVRLWHLNTGAELCTLGGGPQVNGLAFAPDGRFLAAARHDGRLVLWLGLDSPPPLKHAEQTVISRTEGMP